MANDGYPDDDGSRTPDGQHDLGRRRVSCYDTAKMLKGPTVADYLANRLPINGRTDSTGDCPLIEPVYPVDGDANSTGRYNPAAYPSYTSAD